MFFFTGSMRGIWAEVTLNVIGTWEMVHSFPTVLMSHIHMTGNMITLNFFLLYEHIPQFKKV